MRCLCSELGLCFQMRLQYEVFPQDTAQASRLAFLVQDLEIRDRLAQSNINKFLYQYTTESMPRQSHANMVSLKVLTTRPELETDVDEEEVSVRLSVLPIRLNIDQACTHTLPLTYSSIRTFCNAGFFLLHVRVFQSHIRHIFPLP